jgi:hypothetical protein
MAPVINPAISQYWIASMGERKSAMAFIVA